MGLVVGGVNRPRRIVCGQREDGRTYFARVEEIDEVDYAAAYPGRRAPSEIYRIWASDEPLTTLPSDGSTAALRTRPSADETPEVIRQSSAVPKDGGFRVSVVKFLPHERGAPPESADVLHWHDTVTIYFMISGELVATLDSGEEETLRAGDVMVGLGANKLWEVRTEDDGAIFGAVVLPANRDGKSAPPEQQWA